MAEQGRTITLQLSSEKIKDASNLRSPEQGHYSLTINPRIMIPFYARPKVALYNISFANTFANVSQTRFKNATLKVFARDMVTAAATYTVSVGDNPLTITLPDGNYTMSEVEIQIAKQMYTGDPATDGTWAYYLDHAGHLIAGDSVGSDTSYGPIKGAAHPDVPGQWGGPGIIPTENTALTFGELEQLQTLAGYKTLKKGIETTEMQKRTYKPVTIRHDPITNRIQVIQAGYVEWVKDSTLSRQLFGYDDETQLGSTTVQKWAYNSDYMISTTAAGTKTFANAFSLVQTTKHAAKIQMVRAVAMHLPGLVRSSYDRNGDETGAQVASVPIQVPPGSAQSWEAKSPLFVPIGAAGSYIETINWFLTNEDGILLDMQGGRFEATIVVSWPAAKGSDPPPSSFAARTNLSQVLQPWALPNK